MSIEQRARQAEGAATDAYRQTESYTKRNWLWLYPAVAGGFALLGWLAGRLHWPL